ncbi:putative transcription factor bHLH30 [Iris pallida]|uniref:Transcription factor bHLH30 n=1 Tax=Iris pallida TaxID=29817 RepID=A0AAX6EJ66_IRIPA|nr:putative transcription factor bHLH30 [Iris pallida]
MASLFFHDQPTTMPDVSSTAFFSSLPPSFSSASASPHPSSIYGDQFYSRRANSSAMQFSDAGGGQSAVVDHLGLGGLYMPPPPPLSSMSPFGSLHAELISKMTAQEIMDAKALAASKSHSEAERGAANASTRTSLSCAACFLARPKRTRHRY